MSFAGWYTREALSSETAIGGRLKEGPLVTRQVALFKRVLRKAKRTYPNAAG